MINRPFGLFIFLAANLPERSREMPPTDGEVAMPPSIEAVKSGAGDSNAALAANSALSAPYTCNFCQRSFPRLSLLKKHDQVGTRRD